MIIGFNTVFICKSSMYLELKYSHVILVTISIVLFQYRFLLKKLNKPLSKLLKILPHLNDTLLMMTGIGLAIVAGFNPLLHTWLLAKLIALLLYIGFGMVSLKSNGLKCTISYIIATLMVVFMVLTALNKAPLFFTIE